MLAKLLRVPLQRIRLAEFPRDDELWMDDEMRRILPLAPAMAWLVIGFGKEEDVGKVPLHLPEEMPDMLIVRMN